MNGHSDLVITDPIATTDSLSNSDQDEEVENPGDSGTKGENKYNLKLIDSKHPSWDVKPVNFAKEAEKEST